MLIHIAVTCCLAAASLAAPQGYGATRNSVVQGSALPRRFSVSKGSQGKGYLPPSAYATARPQYQSGGNGYQSSAGSQYQGSSGSGSGGYQGGAGSRYSGSGSSQYGSGGSQYGSGSSQYGSGGNQYRNAASQYTTEDPYAEPANYDFSYEVNAPEYAVMFGHQESRRDMLATGSYRVLLPDGRTQVVEYEADQEGYRPTITYQEAAGGAGGYQGGSGGYQGGNQGGYQGGSGGYSQGGNQGGYQGGRGNGGYSQNGNGYKGSTGKASYGQKGYGGQNNGGAGKGQGYRY